MTLPPSEIDVLTMLKRVPLEINQKTQSDG